MAYFQKLRTQCVVKWVSLNFSENLLKSSKALLLSAGSFHLFQNPRFYGRSRSCQSENFQNLGEMSAVDDENVCPVSRSARAAAQAALVEYLHCTRSFQFSDAEYMSKNSPFFLEKILKNVKNEVEIRKSITKFLQYHPINEFEPFFESLGLKPSEYVNLLPRNLMFLCDDQVLLENYHVLCNYGLARNKIGKIYKEATEVFRYGDGVLQLKFQAYEELGLSRYMMIKAVASSPYLLIGDPNTEFVKTVEQLKILGIKYDYIEKHLSEGNFYNWSQMLRLLRIFSKMGFNEEQLSELIRRLPGLLFEDSGILAHFLVLLLLKFGSTMNEIYTMFLQFPQIEVGEFYRNFRQSYLFLKEIEMEAEEIGRIVRSHTMLLGSCNLKKTGSILSGLNVGKKRICRIIKDNPLELKNWVYGSRSGPLPSLGEDLRSRVGRTTFLSNLGYVENSEQMEKACKLFRGNGMELQERFDFLVKSGLDRNDVSEMTKASPQILNQSINVLDMKIDYLLNAMGYPLSSLRIFPSFLCYASQRVELRMSMYNWLKDQGLARPQLALSTVLACSDKYFIKHFVNRHPKGPEVWRKLKQQIYSN